MTSLAMVGRGVISERGELHAVGLKDVPDRTCKTAGCSRIRRARGVCGAHRTHDRGQRVNADPTFRFWAKAIVPFKPGACWEWSGTHHSEGYGLLHVGRRSRYAHRIAYEMMVGPIPKGLQIDHLCRNRGCVRPDHLEVVTMAENKSRGVLFRRAARAAS